MIYIEVEFFIPPALLDVQEILIAELAEREYESFMDTEGGFKAYIQEKYFSAATIYEIIEDHELFQGLKFCITIIKEQNWNSVWEQNFQPVLVAEKCYIRAPFHTSIENIPYEIIIEPKMSFGTGHHETTSMMVELMLEMDFRNKLVLDMGCGTGVLAMLASMLHASSITAIDIDEWSYINTLENIARNNIPNIQVIHGDRDNIPEKNTDIILANINRNILLEDMEYYVRRLAHKGFLFMSGFYQEDLPILEDKANSLGLKRINLKEKNNWIAVIFEKK